MSPLERYLAAVLERAALSSRDEAEVREELMGHLGFLVDHAAGDQPEEVYAMLEREFGDPGEIGDRIAAAKGRFRTYLKKQARKLPMTLAVSVAIALVIRWQVVEVFRMAGSCMEPAVGAERRLVVNKLAYRWGDPTAGDLVIYREGKKRVVALVDVASPVTVSQLSGERKGVVVPREDLVGRVWLQTR